MLAHNRFPRLRAANNIIPRAKLLKAIRQTLAASLRSDPFPMGHEPEACAARPSGRFVRRADIGQDLTEVRYRYEADVRDQNCGWADSKGRFHQERRFCGNASTTAQRTEPPFASAETSTLSRRPIAEEFAATQHGFPEADIQCQKA